MKVCVITFGCKVNQYDSVAVLELLAKAGYDKTDNMCDADIVIFNSCAVTAESVRKLKRSINSVKRNNIDSIIILMGCVPQAFPESEKDFKNVDVFIGNFDKENLVLILNNFIHNHKRIISVKPYISSYENLSVSKFPDRTRAFLKIEDGCNRFCSYCIIPYARGRIRSKSLTNIIVEVNKLAKNGYKEITFVGINLSSYGMDLKENLFDVIEATTSVSSIERIRLGSLEPDLITEDFLIKLSKNHKFCPQFHLSLQSGSNKILKSMRRLYTKEDYLNIVNKIKNLFENCSITTDLIVGFPGESEADFRESVEIIKKVGFLKVHIFPYSIRKGTLAANMPNQISKSVKLSRVKEAIYVATQQTNIILKSFIGKILPVLYENSKDGIYYDGYTSNYILVRVHSNIDIRGKIINTYINNCKNGYCIGQI